MMIRFSSDATTGTSSSLGFTARIENIDPPCGSHLTLNATSTLQVPFLKTCVYVQKNNSKNVLFNSYHS